MRKSVLIFVTTAIALVATTIALATDYRSKATQAADKLWRTSSNWEKKDPFDGTWGPVGPNEYPDDAADSVWIRDGYGIQIDTSSSEIDPDICGKLQIDAGGLVLIQAGGALKLHDTQTSQIDGAFETRCPDASPVNCSASFLIIAGNVQIDGNGGRIETTPVSHGASNLVIKGADSNARLTIRGAVPGDESTSMSLIANLRAIDIQVTLDNRGDVVSWIDSYVEGVHEGGIVLSGANKTGVGGFWRATVGPNGVGLIEVKAPVLGNCTWQILDNAQARIHIMTDVTCQSGDFVIRRGRLELDGNLCTFGKLDMGNTVFGVPNILVHKGHWARFKGPCACP